MSGLDTGMEIKLSQNKITIVDANDYEWLIQFKWSVLRSRGNNLFYAVRQRPGKHNKLIYMHREILCPPNNSNIVVDHIDQDGLNNRRSNLRIATLSQNAANRKPRHGESPYRGVHWNRDSMKWCARIGYCSRNYHLGLYEDEKEAAKAYDAKARELFGEYARLNFSM